MLSELPTQIPHEQDIGSVTADGAYDTHKCQDTVAGRGACAVIRINCIKRLGQGAMAREFDRQVAELQIRTSVLNRFTAPGTPKTVAVPNP